MAHSPRVSTMLARIGLADGPGRHDLVLGARLWVVPGNLLAVPGVFEGLADAVLVDLVHVASDSPAHQETP